MRCPICLNKTKVKDTRERNDNSIRRYRVCIICNHRFATDEHIDSEEIRITKEELADVVQNLKEALIALDGPRTA